MLAPILITVYDRLEHLKACVESLKKCPESKKSTIYIASDNAAVIDHTQSVHNVRDYIESIEGFYKVIPIFWEQNIGSQKNYLDSMSLVFERSETLIYMEDDVIVGKGFLRFINDGLVKYKQDLSVLSICGYLPPNIINKKNNPFFLQSRAPYGFGVWREKELSLLSCFKKEYIRDLISDYSFFNKFESNSPNVARAIPLIVNGDMMPADIVTAILMQEKNLLSIYPPVSISSSRGNDGSGLNSGINLDLQKQIPSDFFYSLDISFEKSINKEMQSKISKYYKSKGIVFINYVVYFGYKLPGGYFMYKFFRSLIKKLRSLK